MKSITKLALAISVGATATLVVIVIRHSPEPSIAHLDRSHQIERPIVAPTPLSLPANHAPKAVARMAVNWDEEFRTSTDYFPLIARAAKAALNGDGRAAYYVSRKWLECQSLVQQYSGTGVQPEGKFNEQMAMFASLPPELIEKKQKQFHDCAGFYKGDDRKGNDVFADLPQRDGGYNSVKFWRDLAYQNNDPIAQTEHAALSISSSVSPTPDQIQVAQVDINHAIASGDPAAIYNAGMIITNGLYADRIQGFALSLAACELGYDCTAKTSGGSDIPFGECVAMGTCSPGETFTDWVNKHIGAEGYAQAYARAQLIKTALAQGDSNALQKFAQLKGPT
jgi:hypothetical protein